MRLTTKSRYAVTAMLDLTMNGQMGPVSLADISVRQHISLSYLEQLFSRLRREGLVESVRGPGGGYRLGRQPTDVSIDAIVNAVEESVDATQCGHQGNCANGQQCLAHDLWVDLSAHIQSFLAGVSLASLAEKAARDNGIDQFELIRFPENSGRFMASLPGDS